MHCGIPLWFDTLDVGTIHLRLDTAGPFPPDTFHNVQAESRFVNPEDGKKGEAAALAKKTQKKRSAAAVKPCFLWNRVISYQTKLCRIVFISHIPPLVEA